ncbi:MAG: transcription antitermination factor NusB [Clostridiales bacterium]|nr:transcription antitermination factor NusB [Clostridiales bacterium]
MSRKSSREKALEILYGMEISKDTPEEAIESFYENYEGDITEISKEYLEKVVKGVFENKEELDQLIEGKLQNWKLERVSKVNLSILRIAIYEMKYIEDVPSKVALNEAIELCKKYSDDKNKSFINGVLDKILHTN